MPRRRPRQLAREIATLDRLSGGRVILGVGLGDPIDNEYGRFDEPTDPAVLADLLDEGRTRRPPGARPDGTAPS